MKNYILFIIISLIISSCQKQVEVSTNHPFVNEIIDSLKDDNKTLIVEFWAPSCSPCIKLKNDIFDNDQNKNFLNENFVLIKVSPSDSLYKSLFKFYNLNTASTVLFFDTLGFEIERSIGYDDNKESYVGFLKDVANRKNLFHEVYEKYRKNNSDIRLNYLLAEKFLFRYENQKAIKHFNYILKYDLDNKHGYHSECLFRIAEYEFLNSGRIEKLKSYVDSYLCDEYVPQAYLYLIKHYKNDHKNCVITSSEALRKYPFNPDLINKHAWNIYLFKIKEDYKEALEMVEKAIAINPNIARYWDTQAWLYFEIGENSRAIISEKKAIELYPHQAYKIALKQFESI